MRDLGQSFEDPMVCFNPTVDANVLAPHIRAVPPAAESVPIRTKSWVCNKWSQREENYTLYGTRERGQLQCTLRNQMLKNAT